MSLIDEIWYEHTPCSFALRLPLLPFSLIFRFASALRRSMYASGVFKSGAPAVPVVVVGGLNAGGAGKTPLCAALLNELQKRGYKPGLLSRGYKSHCPKYPFLVDDNADAVTAGDEPLLIYRQTKSLVVIDPKRTRGAEYLAKLGADVIVCDDGLQHYALERDVEIVVLDGLRMLGNKHLMPAGPLREGKWRLKTVDAIVVNGAVAKIGHYSMMLHPAYPHPVNEDSKEVLPKGSAVAVLAGIGNPRRFYKTVEDLGFKIKEIIEVSDHQKLKLSKLKETASRCPVLMTAKDAIKYEKESLSNVFVIDVRAQLSEQFYDNIINKINSTQNKVQKRQKAALAKSKS